MKPTRYSVYWALALIASGVVACIWGELVMVWYILLFMWILFSVIDIVMLYTSVKLDVSRILPGRFALGHTSDIELTVHNRSKYPLLLSVIDGIPQNAVSDQLPWSGVVRGKGYTKVTYQCEVLERGESYFTESHIHCRGLFRLWSRLFRSGEEQMSRVYPNYEPVVQLALMSMEQNPEQMGIVKKNRSGLSKEFHQLRDYHLGDMLSQIDWKTSSKHRKLISRAYHEQRDQTVILAIDCGRRMRAHDEGIPQFDHCLNAMLLLAYVALRQGDSVGIMAYGGSDRYLPPVKGVNSMTTILNHLYNYQTTSCPSDYSEAAERIMMRQSRRAMVIFLSNMRGEDASDLVDPLRRIRKRHVVTLANLRESEIEAEFDRDVFSLEDALRLSATQKYLDARERVMKQLEAFNIHTLDVTAEQLPVGLANKYLATREQV